MLMCHYSGEVSPGCLQAHRDRYTTAWFECEKRFTEENYRSFCNVMDNFLVLNIKQLNSLVLLVLIMKSQCCCFVL